MNIKNNEKGITLASLVIYIIIFMIIIAIMTTISTFFFNNINGAINTPRYVSEFNKFTMFFGVDIKNNTTAVVTPNTIEFENGLKYEYKDNSIYRNNVRIAKDIISCNFTGDIYTVNSVDKNIINVDIKIGKSEDDSFEKNIDFVLRYW